MLWGDLPASSRPKGAHVRDGVGNTTTSANIASRTLVRDALAPVGRGIRICKDQKRLTNACASRPLSQALVGGVWGDGRLAGRSSKVTSRCFVNREGRGQGARGQPEGCHRRRRARGSTINSPSELLILGFRFRQGCYYNGNDGSLDVTGWAGQGACTAAKDR